jgi:hypothetical protein
MTYITNEQMNLITVVHDNHEVEFRSWAEENESELMKWYETNDHEKMSMFETVMKFAYYCSEEFINWKHSM